ncbi:MAG: hypothetical protein GX256_06305 [Fretibacterium sp.]|nr:hypothetical protein [Fretibacterium sp.]
MRVQPGPPGARRGAGSLLETLLALVLLGLLFPSLLNSLGVGMTLGLRIQRQQDYAYGAEWWFNRVELPTSLLALDAMPRATPDGEFRFSWETAPGPGGALFVSLNVSKASPSESSSVFFRVF